jgi:hypothetical protein
LRLRDSDLIAKNRCDGVCVIKMIERFVSISTAQFKTATQKRCSSFVGSQTVTCGQLCSVQSKICSVMQETGIFKKLCFFEREAAFFSECTECLKLFTRQPKRVKRCFDIARFRKCVCKIPARERCVKMPTLYLIEASGVIERANRPCKLRELHAGLSKGIQCCTTNRVDGRTLRENTFKERCRIGRSAERFGDIRKIEFSARDKRVFVERFQFNDCA